MRENYRFVIRSLLIFGLLLVFHESIIGLYDWTLGRLITLFPAGRLIPAGGYYSSSGWMLVIFAVLLTVPGIGKKSRFIMVTLCLLGYLGIDFFSFLVWIVPPEATQSPGANFSNSALWRFVGQWVLPFFLFFIALSTKFEQMQVSYTKKKNY